MAVIDDNWDYKIDLNISESNKELEPRVSHLMDEFLQLDSFKTKQVDSNISPNNDLELKSLIEQNSKLRNEYDKKLEELNKLKSKLDTLRRDQDLLQQEVKDTHEAFLMAKKYFKKYLNIYYTIESREGHRQTIFLQFFTEAKSQSENYSIRLLRDTRTEKYELVQTIPTLEISKEITKTLQETNDLPGVLYSIRQAFLRMKTKHL